MVSYNHGNGTGSRTNGGIKNEQHGIGKRSRKNELSFEQLEKVSGGFSLFGDEHEDGAKAGTGFVESIWNAGCDLIHLAGCDLIHLAGCDLIHLASGIAN